MDRRQKKTREAVFSTFSELMCNYNYNQITIKDIVDSANVGRATFYAHFETKDALLDEFMQEILPDAVFVTAEKNQKFDATSLTDICIEGMNYIHRNGDEIIRLISGPNRDLFGGLFKNRLKASVVCWFDMTSKDEFLINHISSSVAESICWWITQGMKKSVNEIGTKIAMTIQPFVNAEGLDSDSAVSEPDAYCDHGDDRRDKDRDNKISPYLDALEILSRTTDDYLFLFEFANDKNWFFGNVDDKYEVREQGSVTNTLAQVLEIVHPSDRKMLVDELNEISRGEKNVHNMDCRWIDKDGNNVWINCRGKVIYDENNRPFVMIGRMSEEALRHLYNPLTGLFNKLRMIEDFEDGFADVAGGYLMLIDIDDLAAINLSYGREYGDKILKELAATLDNHIMSKRVYHIDHNYFAVCLDANSQNSVRKFFRDVQSSLREQCTVTAGVVPVDSQLFVDVNNLYDSAKITLRKAKNESKNNLRFFSEEDISKSIHSIELFKELHESVEAGCLGFYVLYQPQLRSGSYEIMSAEALMRYTAKDGRAVYPDEFIPLLEQSGLINAAGLWILEEALMQCREWRKYIPDFRVSVNFSTVQFKDKNISKKIEAILNKCNMPGSALSVEITESIPISEITHFKSVISHLKGMGVWISIDDFGTGYSNISYLKRLMADEIKIDRVFVKGIEKGTYNYNLISNTIEFAKSSAVNVCCEGVENKIELAILETLSPDIFQGYLFDRPLSSSEITEVYFSVESPQYRKRVEFLKELYMYKEQMGIIHFNPRDILRETNVGLWVIRINPQNDSRELHVDETMERILGVDKKYSPSECYEYWFKRVCPDYSDYITTNLQTMVEHDGVVQLQYKWNHPELGYVEVRSSGKRGRDADGMIVLEGYHRIFSNIEEV